MQVQRVPIDDHTDREAQYSGFDFKDQERVFVFAAFLGGFTEKFAIESKGNKVAFSGLCAGELVRDLEFDPTTHCVERHIELIADVGLEFLAFTGNEFEFFANKEDLAEVVGSACTGDAGEFTEFVEVIFPRIVFDAGGFGVGDAHKGDELGVLATQASLCVGEVIGGVLGFECVCILGEGEGDDSGVVDGVGAFIPAYVAGEDGGFADGAVEGSVEVDLVVADAQESGAKAIFAIGAGNDETTGLCADTDQLEVGIDADKEVVGACKEVVSHQQNGQGIEVSALLVLVEDREQPTGGRGATGHAKVLACSGFAHIDQEGDGAGGAEVFSALFDECVVWIFLDPVFAFGFVEGDGGGDAVGLCAGIGIDHADAVGAKAEVVFDGKRCGGALEATGGDLFAAVVYKVGAKGSATALSFDDTETLFAARAAFDLVDDAFFADQVDVGLASREVTCDEKPSSQDAVESESFPSFRESVHKATFHTIKQQTLVFIAYRRRVGGKKSSASKQTMRPKGSVLESASLVALAPKIATH